MNTIMQDIKFRQAIMEYSLKHGVTKAAIRYNANHQYIVGAKDITEHDYSLNHITIQTDTHILSYKTQI